MSFNFNKMFVFGNSTSIRQLERPDAELSFFAVSQFYFPCQAGYKYSSD